MHSKTRAPAKQPPRAGRGGVPGGAPGSLKWTSVRSALMRPTSEEGKEASCRGSGTKQATSKEASAGSSSAA